MVIIDEKLINLIKEFITMIKNNMEQKWKEIYIMLIQKIILFQNL